MNRWEYLITPPFKTRYVLAAHWVQHCPVIVDVGGWKNCVAEFLPAENPAIVYAIDPLLEIPEDRRVIQLRKELKDVELPASDEPFGLVAIGFEIDAGPSFEKLVRLAERADTVVLEGAMRYPPSVEGLENLTARVNKSVSLTLKLDMKGSPLDIPPDSFPPFFERQMFVLK